MATTTPDNLRSPEPGSAFNPVVDFQTLASDVQAALNNRVSKGEIDEIVPATTSTAGVVTRASQGEASVGTNTAKYITPQTMRNATFLPYASAAGAYTGGSRINNEAGTTVSISFPSSRFTRAPHLLVTSSSAARLTFARLSISTSSATVQVDNHSGAAAAAGWGFAWLAIQMSSGNSSG